MGSTLSQLDENGHDHPIHFANKQLTSVEKNTSVNLTGNSKPFAELTEMSNFCYICKHGIQFLCHFLCILLLLSKYLLHNI
jgi:hypothetical protein